MSPTPVAPPLLFLFIFSIRIINAVSIRTFFQPDEYFQALEPAWRLVFGEGWLTWVPIISHLLRRHCVLTAQQEWREELRSIAHPLIFSWLYKGTYLLLNALNIRDESARGELLNVAPRLLQAVFATAGDIYTYKLGSKILGEQAGWTSVGACAPPVLDSMLINYPLVAISLPWECVPLVLLDSDVFE